MRVAEIRRLALARSATTDTQWQQRHLTFLARAQTIVDAGEATAHQSLAALMAEERESIARPRAERARLALLEMHVQVRSLVRLFSRLSIKFRETDDWLATAVPLLRDAYARQRTSLPDTVSLEFLPRFWRRSLSSADEKRRFHVLETATLIQLQRALRNGAVFVPTSLLFRERETLMIPRATWESRRDTHLRELNPGHALTDGHAARVQALCPVQTLRSQGAASGDSGNLGAYPACAMERTPEAGGIHPRRLVFGNAGTGTAGQRGPRRSAVSGSGNFRPTSANAVPMPLLLRQGVQRGHTPCAESW